MAFPVQLLLAIITSVITVCSAVPTGVTSSPDAVTPNPLGDTLRTYYSMMSEMGELTAVHKAAYDAYKVDRFSDPDIYVPPMNIAGMPDLSVLTVAERFAMDESALLQLHRCNLKAFQDLIVFVRLDESQSNSPTDFSANFSIIHTRLARVVAMIEAVMGYQGYFQDGLPAHSTVSLAPNNNELVRNIRDLYVLQELNSYLAVAYNELNLWYSRHKYALASQ